MNSALKELKTRADHLLKRARVGCDTTASRLRKLGEFKTSSNQEIKTKVCRKHALTLIARDFGFNDWAHAKQVLNNEAPKDFGTLLRTAGGMGYLHNWYASYEDARSCQQDTGGYLLAYKNQYFVATSSYMKSLGLGDDDPDLKSLGSDWVHPRNEEARVKLYAKLFRARPKEGL